MSDKPKMITIYPHGKQAFLDEQKQIREAEKAAKKQKDEK